MNLSDAHKTLVGEMGKKLADFQDSAIFAYVELEFERITERGDNPADYELEFSATQPDLDADMRFSYNIRLVKRGEQ